MTTLGTMDGPTYDRFNRICRAVSREGTAGLTLTEIADAGRLARELGSDEPDGELIEFLTGRLELNPEELQ